MALQILDSHPSVTMRATSFLCETHFVKTKEAVIAKIASRLRQRGILLDGDLYTLEGMRDAILRYSGEVKK